jgi:hypothetical protein
MSRTGNAIGKYGRLSRTACPEAIHHDHAAQPRAAANPAIAAGSLNSGRQPVRFPILPALGLLLLAVEVSAQAPQISAGARVMMATDESRYVLQPQPSLFEHLKQDSMHVFTKDIDLLDFFQQFPSAVQQLGLWMTRFVVQEGKAEEDRQRVERLAAEASRRNVPLYICDPRAPAKGALAAWDCTQRSPKDIARKISCEPRLQPHRGHPWWDCT